MQRETSPKQRDTDVKDMSREELEREVQFLRDRCNWLERERLAEAALRHNLSLQVVDVKSRLAGSQQKIREVVDSTLNSMQVGKTLTQLNHVDNYTRY